MACLDNYTNALDAINQIKKILNNSYQIPLTNDFKAVVFTSEDLTGSVPKEHQLALEYLKKIDIQITPYLLPKSSPHVHIFMDAQDGMIMGVGGTATNDSHDNFSKLIQFQTNEYQEFKKKFKNLFSSILVDQRLLCHVKFAQRTVREELKIHSDRNPILSKSTLHLIIQNFECIKELPKEIVDSKDYNLMLRKAASNPKLLVLLKFLLENMTPLEIDPSSKGQNSGTALDVAKKYRNQEAIRLLEYL
jgi:hypothetical protein